MAPEEELGQLQGEARRPSPRREPPRHLDPSEEQLGADAQRQTDTLTLLRRLAGRPAAEVLARIAEGDLLRLFPLCAQRIREAAFLLDPERVFEHALSKAAVRIEIDGEHCAEPGWLAECVDRAIQAILERDRQDEQAGIPPDQPSKHFPVFIESCYVEPTAARLASIRYNALDARIRQGFQKVIVEGEPLQKVLELGLGPLERLQLDILLALKAIGLLDDAGVEELRVKEGQP
ncbi:MAG TPA: hypothetical protein VF530_22185 [Planctomycetota bacterium]